MPTSAKNQNPPQGALRSWLHECTRKESIHLNQRNRTREQPDTHHNDRHRANPADEDKFGIDFWHAVEFSRSGRTPTRRLSATRRGNPSSLGRRARCGQIRGSDRIGSSCPGSTRHLDPSGAGRVEWCRVYLTRAGPQTQLPTRRAPGVPGALTTVTPPGVARETMGTARPGVQLFPPPDGAGVTVVTPRRARARR